MIVAENSFNFETKRDFFKKQIKDKKNSLIERSRSEWRSRIILRYIFNVIAVARIKTLTFEICNWKRYTIEPSPTFTILHHRILKVVIKMKTNWMHAHKHCFWVQKNLWISLSFLLRFIVLNIIYHWHLEITEHRRC